MAVAKPVLAAFPDVPDGAIAIQVTTDANAKFVTLYRQIGGARAEPVRFVYDAPISGGGAVFYDYECPPDQPCSYTATARDAGSPPLVSPTSDPVTITLGSTDTWLRVVGFPAASMKIAIESLPEVTRGLRYSANYVIGRTWPVTIADVRQMSQGELTFCTLTKADADQARYIFSFGQIVVLQGQSFEGGVRYLLVTDLTEARVSAIAQYVERRWTATFISTQAPVLPNTTDVPHQTYQLVLTTYASYQALFDTVASYATLILPSGSTTREEPSGASGGEEVTPPVFFSERGRTALQRALGG